MASAKDIKKRIKGIKNIQQITRAMEMVAGAKLRRAQILAESAKSYAEKIQSLMQNLGSAIATIEHPLLVKREEKNVALIVITSDRGLCGAYNANLFKKVQAYFSENQGKKISLFCVGKKGNDFFKQRNYDIQYYSPSDNKIMTLDKVNELVGKLIKEYSLTSFDKILIIFSKFVSVMNQLPTERPLLPVEKIEEKKSRQVDYIFEPGPESLLEKLFPKYLENQLYNAIVESYASELAARLVSMKNATKSAGEMMDSLTLSYNKARQAGITKEILEIISGAEALKG